MLEFGYRGDSAFEDLWKTWIIVIGKVVLSASLYLRAAERRDSMFFSKLGVDRSDPKYPLEVFSPTWISINSKAVGVLAADEVVRRSDIFVMTIGDLWKKRWRAPGS